MTQPPMTTGSRSPALDESDPVKDLTDIEAVSATALIHEAMGKRGALHHEFSPTYPGARFCGRALTVRCPPADNLTIHLAISVARPGDVLVVTMDNFLEAGVWGEIATVAAQVRGIRGLVLDGSVRDLDAIARLKFPVFCRGRSIKGTTKRAKGEINRPISLGGVYVVPGDIVIGDTDGVVVIPQAEMAQVISKAREIQLWESEVIEKLRNGVLTLDLLNLRPALAALSNDSA